MSSKDSINDIRRILIALDASPASQAALELALAACESIEAGGKVVQL